MASPCEISLMCEQAERVRGDGVGPAGSRAGRAGCAGRTTTHPGGFRRPLAEARRDMPGQARLDFWGVLSDRRQVSERTCGAVAGRSRPDGADPCAYSR